jgi:hypothetical protein
MRKRYLISEERINHLLSVIGESKDCNRFKPNVEKKLKEFSDNNIQFQKAIDIGSLLRMHLSEQLNI